MLRKLFNGLFALAMLAAGLWIAALPSFGTPDYAKKEKKGCTYCHPAGKTTEFTKAGQYYKDHDHSFEGFDAGDAKTK